MKSLEGYADRKGISPPPLPVNLRPCKPRYDYFAGAAKKDGFVQIADIFTETALQEKEHAKRLFKIP